MWIVRVARRHLARIKLIGARVSLRIRGVINATRLTRITRCHPWFIRLTGVTTVVSGLLLRRRRYRCRRSGEEHFAPAFQTVYRLLQGHLEGRRVLMLNLGLWCDQETQDNYCTDRGE
jgi:hypothetical protein